MVRVRDMRGGYLLCCAVFAGNGAAWAAPWTQSDGGYYARGAYVSETLDGVGANRFDGYGEYGVTRNWTVTGKAEAVAYGGEDAVLDSESYRLTVRRALWRHNGWVAGAELGAIYGATAAGVFGCQAAGGEARLSGGYSGARKGRSFYAFADVAVLAYDDGCQRERVELGYGSQLYGRVHISQQVWLEQGNQSATSYKYETMLSYHFDKFQLSGGYREEFGPAFDENAWVIAVTVRH